MCISWSKIPTWVLCRYVEVDMCVWVGTERLNKDYQGTEASLHNCTEAMPDNSDCDCFLQGHYKVLNELVELDTLNDPYVQIQRWKGY